MNASDRLGRPLRDLRISVTDRCNFRCTYCMPKEVFGSPYAFLPRSEILSFEEITRLSRIFVGLGVEKLRLTGGEPLLRKDLEKLVGMLRAIEGVLDLTLTTNGALLESKAQALRTAGLTRLTVSLDSLQDSTFSKMNDVAFPVARVLHGIDAALRAGFAPIKINVVVQRGINDGELISIARHFRAPEFIVRFIEFMDVGETNHWRLHDVVPGSEIISRINAQLPLETIPPNYPGEVARRFRYIGPGPQSEIGVITSVSNPFCGNCTRARLSADGHLYTCLFAGTGQSLRDPMRAGATDKELETLLRTIWSVRTDRYSELRATQTAPAHKTEMSVLGG